MSTSAHSSRSSVDDVPAIGLNPLQRGRKTDHYRVAALPAGHALTDDVIICDSFGRSYLLSHDGGTPIPLDQDEVNSLGMFFEPSQDFSWHTVPELRRIIFGVSDADTVVS